MKSVLLYIKPANLILGLLVLSCIGIGFIVVRDLIRTPNDYASIGFNYAEKQDFRNAYRFLKKAADKGHIDAQYKLALMFDVGDKIPEDRHQALKYMKMASEQGMADACYALAVWQERGYPTGQDPIDLYEKAAQQGNKNAMTSLIVRYEGINPERQLYWYNKLNGRQN